MKAFKTTHCPRALYSHATSLEIELQRRIKKAIENGTSLDPLVISRIRAYPHILEDFVKKALIPDNTLHLILNSESLIFELLMTDYEAFKNRLEPHIYSDLSCLERLIKALKEAEAYSINLVPLVENVVEYYHMLSADPNRLLRMTDVKKEETQAELLQQARSKFLDSAAWAFFLISNETQLGKISPKIVETIMREEEYVCRTLTYLSHHKDRFSIELEQLLSGIKSPEWAYHALLNAGSLKESSVKRLEQILVKSPAWAVEFVSEIQYADGGRADELFIDIMSQNAKGPFVAELLAWARSRQPRALGMSVPAGALAATD